MDGLICLSVSFIFVVVFIVVLVKYIRKPSYHGQGYDKLIGKHGFVVRASQFDGDMRVEVNAENWLARCENKHVFKDGDKIIVKKINQDEMVLLVEPLDS